MIQLKKNIQSGKVSFLFLLIYFFLINSSPSLIANENNEGKFVGNKKYSSWSSYVSKNKDKLV